MSSPGAATPSTDAGATTVGARARTALAPVAGVPRIVAVDLVRFLAVVGMMGAHLGGASVPDWVALAIVGFPSSAFAVIGGVSSVLATERYRREQRHLAASLSLAARGLAVAVIGLLLTPISYPIVVVLTYFGLGLVLLALVLRLPAPVLLAVAAILAVVGPYLNVAVRTALHHPSFAEISYASPLDFAASLTFTGTYPVITWFVFLLIGAAVGRLLIRRPGEPLIGLPLALVGAAMTAFAVIMDAITGTPALPGDSGDGSPRGHGIRFLFDSTAHTGSLGDVLRTAGAAIALLGILLLATRASSRVPRWLEPVRAAGAAPLTVYSLHVLVYGLSIAVALRANPDLFSTATPDWWVRGVGLWALHVVGAIVVGLILMLLHRRGPLEALVGLVAAAAARLSPGRRRASGLAERGPAPSD